MIPSHPVAFWQYFDLVTLSALFIVITLLLVTHRRKTGNLLGSISSTVAATKKSSTLFSTAMTIFFPLYYAFLWLWVGPTVVAPRYLYYLLGFSAICEMTFVWVPATSGKSKKVHLFMASMVGLAMFGMALILLLAGQHMNRLSIAGLILFLVVTLILITLLVFKQTRKYTFTYECIYNIAFLLAISIIAHS